MWSDVIQRVRMHDRFVVSSVLVNRTAVEALAGEMSRVSFART
jgi:hypothetical protein